MCYETIQENTGFKIPENYWNLKFLGHDSFIYILYDGWRSDFDKYSEE